MLVNIATFPIKQGRKPKLKQSKPPKRSDYPTIGLLSCININARSAASDSGSGDGYQSGEDEVSNSEETRETSQLMPFDNRDTLDYLFLPKLKFIHLHLTLCVTQLSLIQSCIHAIFSVSPSRRN